MSVYVKQLQLGPMKNFVYLVGPADSSETAVIDAAWDVPAILNAAAQDGRRITQALVTHRHFDHTNGLEELQSRVDAPTAIHPDEIPHVDAQVRFTPVTDREVVEVGGLRIDCIHTPGHTSGSLCFHIGGEDEAIFGGDTIFVQHCGRCDLSSSDPRQMFDSLHRVLAAFPDRTKVYPGHDYGDVPISTLGRERERNPYFQCKTVDAFVAYRMR